MRCRLKSQFSLFDGRRWIPASKSRKNGKKDEYSRWNAVARKTGEEDARLSRLKAALKPLIDEAIVDMVTTGVTEEKLRAFAERAKTAGSEEYRSIYQEIYTRWTSAE